MRETEKLTIELYNARKAQEQAAPDASEEEREHLEERVKSLEHELSEKHAQQDRRTRLEDQLALALAKDVQEETVVAELMTELGTLDPIVRPYRLRGTLSVTRAEFARWMKQVSIVWDIPYT